MALKNALSNALKQKPATLEELEEFINGLVNELRAIGFADFESLSEESRCRGNWLDLRGFDLNLTGQEFEGHPNRGPRLFLVVRKDNMPDDGGYTFGMFDSSGGSVRDPGTDMSSRQSVWEKDPFINRAYPGETQCFWSWWNRDEMEEFIAQWILRNASPEIAARLQSEDTPPTADLQGAAASLG